MTYIRKIEITEFGKFKNYSMEFNSGYNEFIFENEFGKSTITDFIVFMLYGFTKTTSKRITLEQNYLKKYIPWGSDGKISGALELEADGKAYRIERFQRETGRGAVVIRNSTGEEITTSKSPGLLFFGVDTDTFLRTFAVRQTDMKFYGTGGIESALKNLVTTGDEDTSFNDATETLRRKKAKFQHGDRRSGRIFDIPGEITDLEETKKDCKRRLFSLSENVGVIESLKNHIDQLASKESALRLTHEKAKKADALRDIQKLCSVDSDIEACERKIKLSENIPDSEKIKQLNELFEQKEILSKKAEQSEQEANTAKVKLSVAKSTCPHYDMLLENDTEISKLCNAKTKTNTLLLIIGIVLMIAGGGLSLWNLLVGLAILLAGAVSTVLAFIIRKPVQIPEKYGMNQQQLQQAHSIFSSQKQEIEIAEAIYQSAAKAAADDNVKLQECENLCLQTGIKSKQEISAMIVQKQNLDIIENQLRRLKIDREGILRGRDENELRKLSEGADTNLPGAIDIATQLSQVIEEKNRLISKLTALEKDNKEKSELERIIYECDQKILLLQQEYKNATYQNEVLDIASKALIEAYEKINSIYSPILSEKAQNPLMAFTDGKYSKVYLDKNFDIRLQSGSETKELGFFSKGTQDAVYFALRSAVGELISGGKVLPLILDDPFWALDNARMEKSKEFLKKLALFKQIIIFSAR